MSPISGRRHTHSLMSGYLPVILAQSVRLDSTIHAEVPATRDLGITQVGERLARSKKSGRRSLTGSGILRYKPIETPNPSFDFLNGRCDLASDAITLCHIASPNKSDIMRGVNRYPRGRRHAGT